MAFIELIRSIGGMFSRVTADMTRRPDGGTSHYRPLRKKASDPAAMQAADPQGETRKYDYVHTGFTGMNPPGGFGYEQAGNQPPFGGQQGFGGRPGNTMVQQDYVGKGSFAGPSAFQQDRKDNISYMPGFAPNPDSRTPVHVEHIITLTGLKSCYDAIENMKDGETLIVMLDAIANESESIRCQDMLAGAAFTLGCTVRMLQGGRIVLIAPEGVKILPEQAGPAGVQRPPEIMTARVPMAETQAIPRRERRMGANAAEWNAARNGELDGYNPYTGTMPAAAGSYGRFGGYGY